MLTLPLDDAHLPSAAPFHFAPLAEYNPPAYPLPPDGWLSNAVELIAILAKRQTPEELSKALEDWIFNKWWETFKWLEARAFPDNSKPAPSPASSETIKVLIGKCVIIFDHQDEILDLMGKTLKAAAGKGNGAAAGSDLMWLLRDFQNCKIPADKFLGMCRYYARYYGAM